MRDPSAASCRRWAAATAAFSLALAPSACAATPQTQVEVAAKQADPTFTVLLVGDAGAPAEQEPVLTALHQMAAKRADRTMVIFLGDNVYPDGMPPVGDAWRPEAERRLGDQVAAVRDASARAIFVPGNHDWRRGPAGLVAQASFIQQRGAGAAELLPTGGCPGPVVRQLVPGLRLIVLDTSWWFRPDDRSSGCEVNSDAAWFEAVEAAFDSPTTDRTLVVAHHPLESAGRHGGHYAWDQHLFPLRDIHPALWLPLPLIGSIYPVARMLGIADQDITSERYGELRAGVRRAMRKNPPALYAAGHEHNLQVLRGVVARTLVISGAGIFDHTTRVPSPEETLFAAEQAGFMRLDLQKDGQLRLGVLTVDAAGSTTEVFSKLLD